jgi:hypothetical protein
MVEVFKTNIRSKNNSKIISNLLNKHYPHLKINFDLEDCDKILRVEGEFFFPQEIAEVLIKKNFKCEILE